MSFIPGGLENFLPELRIVASLRDRLELHGVADAGKASSGISGSARQHRTIPVMR
jgi:hypothetical protein